MERDELKRLCGINNSARIYSQLQRDYAKVCNCHPPTHDGMSLCHNKGHSPLVNINSGHLSDCL